MCNEHKYLQNKIAELLMCKILYCMSDSKIYKHTDNFTEVIFKTCIFHCCLCGRFYFSEMDRANFSFPHLLLEPCYSYQEV